VIVASSGGDSSMRSGRRIVDCSSAMCTASEASAATARTREPGRWSEDAKDAMREDIWVGAYRL
jgi:hypothetical protein